MEELLRNQYLTTHAVAAVGSVTLSAAATYPLDTLKTLIQVGAGASQQLVTSQVLDRVRSVSGYRGLYNGFGWLAVGRIPAIGARFGTYELLTGYYKDGRADNYIYVNEALLSGFAAGAMEAIVSTPFELLKLRSQVTSTSRHPSYNCLQAKQGLPPLISKLLRGYTADKKAWDHTVGLLSVLPTKHSNTVDSLKNYPWMMTGTGRPPLVRDVKGPLDIVSLEGWSALWRGLRPAVVRDSIYGGVFFSIWQFFHIIMLDWKAIDMDPPPRSIEEIGPVSPLAASLVAGFSGSIAAAASHCFDSAKSRSQCIVLPKYILKERKLLKWKQQGYWIERVSGINPLDRNFLFRGIGLRMARSGLASFAMVGGYFLLVDYLL